MIVKAGITAVLFLSLLWIKPAIAVGSSTFTEGNTKYQSGYFKGAIDFYESILKSGKETAVLDYNLGNAYFRLGHKGKALAYYERALKILPRNEDIHWNIDIVKSAVSDRIEPIDEGLTVTWIKKITDQLTINELAMILSTVLILFTTMSFLAFVFPTLKPFIRGASVLVVFIFLAVTILFGFKWVEVKDPRVVIIDKEVEARYGPSDKETRAFMLHEGAEAKVTDESKDWCYVTLENKSAGWIPKKACEVI